MTSIVTWSRGARLQTLPTALAPVLLGWGVALTSGGVSWWRPLLALGICVALVVGVNYANDYSDGVRGTDDDRVGPLRLVASASVPPRLVRRAAWVSFAVALVFAAVAGALTTAWAVPVVAICVLAAWFYTGGSHPYGYSGFGEISVFVFFGGVGVLGTQYLAQESITVTGVVAAVAVGSFCSAVLVINNLRDIDTDRQAGKMTASVRLGASRTAVLYVTLVAVPYVCTALLALRTPTVALAWATLPMAVWAAHSVITQKAPAESVFTLKATVLALFAWSVLAFVGLAAAGHS